MRDLYDAAAIRAAEEPLLAALPAGALMQRAATGLAAVCARVLAASRGSVYGTEVVLLVGRGNNGGDALHAGAWLARRGCAVTAVPVGTGADGVHAEGLADLTRSGGRLGSGLAALERADLVLDGIVGIGARGALREDAAAAVVAADACGALLVAVDVPSGVDASTGEVAGEALHADLTVTFGALKPGLAVDPGRSHAGLVEVVDIGLDLPQGRAQVLELADVVALLPAPAPESDKYRRGVVGVVAGSGSYTGAAVLSVGGAVRGGAGMVRYVGPAHPAEQVRTHWPEVVVGSGRVQAHVAGPGTGTDEDARERLAETLDAAREAGVPVLLDADAITLLGADDRQPGEVLAGVAAVLTPHAGELARLMGADRADVEARRLHHARAAAAATGAVVLLKGSTTLVARPDGAVRVNPTGTPWLATAGSGDVLSGLGGALLARGLEPFDAASVAAWVHGLAGRLASGDRDGFGTTGGAVSATDVLEALPTAARALAEQDPAVLDVLGGGLLRSRREAGG